MAISIVSICNSALIKVGCATISALDDGSREANIMQSLFETKRDDVLTAFPWHHSTTRAIWTPNAIVPAFEYAYTYDLPANCLRVVDLLEDFEFTNDEDDVAAWVVEGRTLLTDYDSISARFIWRNTDASTWDAPFAEALAWSLAEASSYALTQSSDREKVCQAEYDKRLALARSSNSAEGILKGLVVDQFTNARR